MHASPLGRLLAEKTGAEVDKGGRIVVQPDMSVAGHPTLFVIGDLACFEQPSGEALPGVAAVAMQQGRYVANLIERRLRGENLPPFNYKDRGSMAVIGRNAAVADLGWLRVWGFPAWLLWIFVHLLYLAQFQNRLLVLAQWTWSYITQSIGTSNFRAEYQFLVGESRGGAAVSALGWRGDWEKFLEG